MHTSMYMHVYVRICIYTHNTSFAHEIYSCSCASFLAVSVQMHRHDFQDLVGVNSWMYILIMGLVVIDGVVPVSVRV